MKSFEEFLNRLSQDDVDYEKLALRLYDKLKEQQDLEYKIRRQKEQLRQKDVILRDRSVVLDAMHYVWCSGHCKGGVHRYHKDMKLTEEIVHRATVECNRIKKKYNNLLFDALPEKQKWFDINTHWSAHLYHRMLFKIFIFLFNLKKVKKTRKPQ